jgi:subtilisin family serine protease
MRAIQQATAPANVAAARKPQRRVAMLIAAGTLSVLGIGSAAAQYGGYGGGYGQEPSYGAAPRYGTPAEQPARAPKPAPKATNQPPGQAAPPPARRNSGNQPPGNERRFDGNEVVIELNGRPSQNEVDALAQRHQLNRIESQPMQLTDSTFFRWRIPDNRNVRDVIRQLGNDPAVRSVQPNYAFTLQQQPSQASLTTGVGGDAAQYAIGKLRLPQAHNITRGDKVLVAVIDSGVDRRHPELRGVVSDSFDALGGDEPPHAHGTGIAGTIAARARLMGVAPAASIIAIRAFGATDKGAESTSFLILKSIDYAVEQGARVINMSFAGPHDPAIQRLLAAARAKGVVLIAAAGNAGPNSPPLFPAADPNVIAVTATDSEDRLFSASNRGRHIAIAAPGVDILVPAPGASYQIQSGTSFAAAHVSGVAALLLERRPDLTPDAVRKILISTARDLGPRGRDDQFGAGLADAFNAIMVNEPKRFEASGAPPR